MNSYDDINTNCDQNTGQQYEVHRMSTIGKLLYQPEPFKTSIMKSFSCPRYVHWPILSLLYQTRRTNPLSIQRVDMVYIPVTSLW